MKKFLTIDEWVEKILEFSYDPLFNIGRYLEHQNLTDLQKQTIIEKYEKIIKKVLTIK